MSPVSEKRKKSMIEYARRNLKRIPLDVQNDYYERILAHTEKRGEKVNAFIKRAIKTQMERDNAEDKTNADGTDDADDADDDMRYLYVDMIWSWESAKNKDVPVWRYLVESPAHVKALEGELEAIRKETCQMVPKKRMIYKMIADLGAKIKDMR